MVLPILCSKARWISPSLAALRPSSVCRDPFHCSLFSGLTSSFLGLPRKRFDSDSRNELTTLAQVPPVKNPVLRLEVSSDTNFIVKNVPKTKNEVEMFDDIKQRFLSFKKRVYSEKLEHYQRLAEVQVPKFMVIACADSRVCPSNILGFQPGEAFMIRNVANLVPPLENGPSETNAALEFAVNTLEVENILVIGHSRCGGIETLMSMQDELSSSFIHKWITKAKFAKLKTRNVARSYSFDEQCRHCEKESVNRSLLNLLTYPWIEDRVKNNLVSIHGGYYDFLNCTFEKWILDVNNDSSNIDGAKYLFKDHEIWS
ncbi:beta carbonic anhydrase 5, chloroplastic-like isoform X1 [Humulus lupulus]|uniref:beta carbonic anhydrase 5, chloroplastic-like isoform X1 n=1 Tax=Humulus lupulus TaxID=3486 RepID=UPI002B4069A7|nr:beta carbonic anhydrase 5, chloroplastic-like isoform X1 [Humulus lupulus]